MFSISAAAQNLGPPGGGGGATTCGGLSNAGPYCSALQGQIPGTTTNDNASTGNIGEYVESNVAIGSAVSLVNGTAKDITTISLTAGDWDVEFIPLFTGGNTTLVTYIAGSISTTANTLDTTNGRIEVNFFNSNTAFNTALAIVGTGAMVVRLSLSATTTIHAVAQASFSTSTASAFGLLRARRVR